MLTSDDFVAAQEAIGGSHSSCSKFLLISLLTQRIVTRPASRIGRRTVDDKASNDFFKSSSAFLITRLILRLNCPKFCPQLAYY